MGQLFDLVNDAVIVLHLAEFAFPPYESAYDLLSLILDGSWDGINENNLCSLLERNATENGDQVFFPGRSIVAFRQLLGPLPVSVVER